VECYRTSCRKEEEKLERLRQKRMKEECLVKDFEKNNEGYPKIRKFVEKNVHNALSDSKVFLRYANLSLIESIRKEPENIDL
jgi:hypothetical protein